MTIIAAKPNFGRVRDQLGLPAPEARLIWDILGVIISPPLPWGSFC